MSRKTQKEIDNDRSFKSRRLVPLLLFQIGKEVNKPVVRKTYTLDFVFHTRVVARRN